MSMANSIVALCGKHVQWVYQSFIQVIVWVGDLFRKVEMDI